MPFCARNPDPKGQDIALFVGEVVDVYPKSIEHYMEIVRQVQLSLPQEKKTDGGEIQRQLWLKVWGQELTAEEREKLEHSDAGRASSPFAGMHWNFPRRVRFRIVERFAGTASLDFELFTGIGGGDCGVGFEVGQTYLVDSFQQDKATRWSASICSGTRHVKYATEDLRSLRAWKEGKPLPPRIYGVLEDWTDRRQSEGQYWKPFPGVELRLTGPEGTTKATTDAEGHFAFENLRRNKYRIEADLPGWRLDERKQTIDLATQACADLYLTIKQEQGRIRGRVAPAAGESLPAYLWIEAIPVNPPQPRKVRSGVARSEDPRFDLDQLEPGRYRIALNVDNPATSRRGLSSEHERYSPYPPLYYPGVREESQAYVFEVNRGQIVELDPWTLPARLNDLAVHIQVLLPDRTAVSEAEVKVFLQATSKLVLVKKLTHRDKTFVFWGLENLAYRVEATATHPIGGLKLHGVEEAGLGATNLQIVLKPQPEK